MPIEYLFNPALLECVILVHWQPPLPDDKAEG